MFWDKVYQVQRRFIPIGVERQIMYILVCLGGVFERAVSNIVS